MPVETLLVRTVGRWQMCPLWVLRGVMFSPAEKCVIIALMDFWHSAGRPPWFYATNRDLAKLSGLSYRGCWLARQKLLKKCLIETQPGKRGRPSSKHLNPATAYHFSQDFLYELTKADKTNPLTTRTTSVIYGVDIIPRRDE